MTLSLKQLPTPTFSQFEKSSKLGALDVHIHCLDIRQFTADHYVAAQRIMSTAEHDRALKFVRGRESYIASRWLLRTVLARYTSVRAETVEFLRTDKGKPYLPQRNIHFSLSHSGDWALLAVSKAELIGVDVEAVRATRDLCGIAENYYHPHEFAQLQILDSAAQADHFYRLWTLKEAFFKALGTGISAGLEKIKFELGENRIAAQMSDELGGNADEWQFHQWALTTHDYCALACKKPYLLEVNWFDALAAPAFP